MTYAIRKRDLESSTMKLEENKRKMTQRTEGMMIQAPYHGYHPAPTGSEPNTSEMNPIRNIYG